MAEQIITSKKQFDRDLFDMTLKDCECGIKYSNYVSSVKYDYAQIYKVFPDLKMTILPSKEESFVYLSGILIHVDEIESLNLKPHEYNRYGLEIFVIFPKDYRTKGVKIYDSHFRINVSNIPYELMHMNTYNHAGNIKGNLYCSHAPNKIFGSNPALSNIRGAYRLSLEYMRYDKTGEFNLECHGHGEEGIKRGKR